MLSLLTFFLFSAALAQVVVRLPNSTGFVNIPLLPGTSYLAPPGGCLATVSLSGGGGGGFSSVPGGGGASLPVVFWSDGVTPLSVVLGGGGAALGGGGASALLAGAAVVAVAGGGGGASGGANNASALPQNQTAGGNAGWPRLEAWPGGSFFGALQGGRGGSQVAGGSAGELGLERAHTRACTVSRTCADFSRARNR
jgi:hypothetical protein